MIVCRTRVELFPRIAEWKRAGVQIGFVPTMGALHDGHLSLVRVAREHARQVVVSIFVNPTQFGPNEDFSRYPRAPERDLELLERERVELVWMPDASEMYGHDEQITVDPGPVAKVFEGVVRPEHFRGVLTVVAKLLHQVQPDVAVFGQKDAQQLFLVRRMVADLAFPLRIVEAPTARESDGLARSSRNVYLKQVEREQADALWRALSAGKGLIMRGERSLAAVERSMRDVLASVPGCDLQYATVVSETGFSACDPLAPSGRLIIAVKLGSVRLIDNEKYEVER
jgi:pantoate--beta-alanine ligase